MGIASRLKTHSPLLARFKNKIPTLFLYLGLYAKSMVSYILE